MISQNSWNILLSNLQSRKYNMVVQYVSSNGYTWVRIDQWKGTNINNRPKSNAWTWFSRSWRGSVKISFISLVHCSYYIDEILSVLIYIVHGILRQWCPQLNSLWWDIHSSDCWALIVTSSRILLPEGNMGVYTFTVNTELLSSKNIEVNYIYYRFIKWLKIYNKIVFYIKDVNFTAPPDNQIIRKIGIPLPAGIEPTWREFVDYLIDTDLASYGDDHWMPYYLFCTPCSLNYTIVAKVISFYGVERERRRQFNSLSFLFFFFITRLRLWKTTKLLQLRKWDCRLVFSHGGSTTADRMTPLRFISASWHAKKFINCTLSSS